MSADYNPPSIFILKEIDSGWIIEKIVTCLANEFSSRGIPVQIGFRSEYSQQQIVLHTRVLFFTPIPNAINWAFSYHIDDILKEYETIEAIKKLDGIITMSPDQESFLKGLLTAHGIKHPYFFSEPLPVLGNPCLKPLVFAYFAECYPDHRKNEAWLTNLAAILTDEEKSAFTLRFLGKGWERVSTDLSHHGISTEHINLTRLQDYEYEAQLNYLSSSNYLLYLGNDGGAMSVYDALSQGIGILATRTCYHIGLEDRYNHRFLFSSENEFRQMFREIIAKEYLATKGLLVARSIKRYASQLLDAWKITQPTCELKISSVSISDNRLSPSTISRLNYNRVTLRRFLQSLKRILYKLSTE